MHPVQKSELQRDSYVSVVIAFWFSWEIDNFGN